jgi:hypothetical protein
MANIWHQLKLGLMTGICSRFAQVRVTGHF